MGTTFSGLAFVGEEVVVSHIGDSRVYLLRDGEVTQITTDHTFVQRLVELGRITPEEALVHPRRSVLMRVLGDVEEQPEIDTEIMKIKAGDRWLVCSDGLCGVVPDALTAQIMKSPIGAGEACELLVGEALEFGAPDNVTVIVVDVVSSTAAPGYVPEAKFVGSAANEVVIDDRRGNRLLRLFNPKLLPDLLGHAQDPAAFKPESDEYLEYILSQTRTKIRNHRLRQGGLFILIVAMLAGALGAGYLYTQTRYYVGSYNGSVAIFQGIKESLGPFSFSHLYEVSDVSVTPFSEFQKEQLIHTIPAESLEDAYGVIQRLVELSANDN
jgi:protein phosphatase